MPTEQIMLNILINSSNIINLYKDGYSMEYISNIYNCSSNPIERILKSNKVQIRHGKQKILTDDQAVEVCDLYLKNKTMEEISNIYNCSCSVISRILKQHKINTRRRGSQIKYKIDINLFKEINCEFNAYFLGFIYADGNISKHLNTITLQLHQQDEEILEKFKNVIFPDYIIKKNKSIYRYIKICQIDIVNQFINLGCLPNKSLILKFPTCIPTHLIHHFLRGYSDGDGCISKYIDKRGHYRYSWDITSTDIFCKSTKELIKNTLNINSSFRCLNYYNNNITSRLSIGGNLQLEKFLDWIYKDATIFLFRKHEKYLEFKKYNKMRYSY